MKAFCALLRFLRVVFLFFPILSTAGPVRTFTSSDGKPLEAELVSLSGQQIVVRRVSDSKFFAIAVNRLSVEDKAFIQQWAAGGLPDAAGWRKVRIHLPYSCDNAFPTGMYSALERVEPNVLEGRLAEGMWLELNIDRKAGFGF